MNIISACVDIPREAVLDKAGDLVALFRLNGAKPNVLVAAGLSEWLDRKRMRGCIVKSAIQNGWRGQLVITDIKVRGTSLGGMTGSALGLGECIVPSPDDDEDRYDTGCDYVG